MLRCRTATGATTTTLSLRSRGTEHRRSPTKPPDVAPVPPRPTGRSLTPRRKVICERIYGPAKALGARAANAAMGRGASAKSADAFAKDTAKATGQ